MSSFVLKMFMRIVVASFLDTYSFLEKNREKNYLSWAQTIITFTFNLFMSLSK